MGLRFGDYQSAVRSKRPFDIIGGVNRVVHHVGGSVMFYQKRTGEARTTLEGGLSGFRTMEAHTGDHLTLHKQMEEGSEAPFMATTSRHPPSGLNT